MWGRGVLLVSLALIALGTTTKCPKRKMSPIREILCYTSVFDAQLLTDSVCSCTTLVHQHHDVRNLSVSHILDLRKSLKEMHPPLQFVISIYDPAMTLRNSAMVRQEAIARIITVIKEVDGVEMNVTAGSKERLYNFIKSLRAEMIRKSDDKRIFLALPSKPEDLAKQFDMKELVKYIDLFTLSTDYMTDEDGAFVTFHPSRLMGLFDMLNTDSLVDLISELGAPKQKIMMTLPANAYRFALKHETDNAPRSQTTEKEPTSIDRQQLCEAINDGEWTVERDEDLTAPYAFQNKTWIAFEDKISVGIKGKYALLRDLAGLAVRNIENDIKTECEVPLTEEIYRSFTEFRRKSRQAVLNALEDELHQTQFSYPNQAKTSSFRVVRVVDSEGHIRAVRESTQTEFVCRRQGYFVHPKSCNRFYRCVKFNQAIEDYSVFEFDCPAGLSFDERTEVCVWPGSLPQGSPCPGSSEIAPVAPKRFECSQPGYYADPQNCRWFFACMDLGESELMAFEFRCPYGLVFDEKRLVCEWPWLVPACSESGSAYTRAEYNYGGGYTVAGSSTGAATGGYITGGLPQYSATAGTGYSNVDYSKTAGTGVHGGNYFAGSTVGYHGKHTSGAAAVSGYVGSSGLIGVDYSKPSGYGTVSSIPTYTGRVDSVLPAGESSTGYSASNDKISNTGYTVSTGYGSGSRYSGGYTGSSGGITTGFSGSAARGYSGTVSGNHLTEGDVIYSNRPEPSYSVAGGYTGSVGVSNPVVGTVTYPKTPSYFASTESPGSSVNIRVDSAGSVGSTNLYTGSSAFNADGYSASTGIYSGATERQPSFNKASSSFGIESSYPGAIGGQSTKIYQGSTSAGYPKATSGILQGSTSPGRVSATDFGGGASKFVTSGISAVSGRTDSRHFISGSVPSSGVTGASSTKYNDEKEYTVPYYLIHGEPIPFRRPGTGIRDYTPGVIRDYKRPDLARPNLNISNFGNGISTGYDVQKGATGTLVTGSGVQESIFTSDSTSGNVFSIHGNVPGTISPPAVNQGTVLTGRVQPGYIASGTPSSGVTGASSTKYNDEEGYTVPVYLIHGEPVIPLARPEAGVRDYSPDVIRDYKRPDLARPNLNISIFGNEIPTGYNVQKGATGTLVTGSGVQGNIFTSDSTSGNVISLHGNVPSTISPPAINQGTVLTGRVQPGYIASGTPSPGYVIRDKLKTVDGSARPGTLTYGSPTPAISVSGPSTSGVILKNDISPGIVISGYTAPGISIGSSGQSGTIESSTGKSYISQAGTTYHGVSGDATRGCSSSSPSGGLTRPQGYKTDVKCGIDAVNTAYDAGKYSASDVPDYRPTSANLPESIVSGGRIQSSDGVIFGSISQGSTTFAPRYSSPTSAVFTPSGFTKTGLTKTGITTAILGGGGSFSVSTSERRPPLNTENISEKAFEGNVAGYTKTSFSSNAADLSVTLTPPDYSSTASPRRVTVQSATSGYSYPKPNVQLGTNERRPDLNIENISEKTFEGNMAGYTKTSSNSNAVDLSVTLTPLGYSSTASPSRVTVQSATPGYSYPKPSVQLGTSGVTSSSISPSESNLPITSPKPFSSINAYDGSLGNVGATLFGYKTPTSTDRRLSTPVSSIIYTTEHPEIYEATLFEAAKIPAAVSTVRPVVDDGYKTGTVPSNILLTDDRFIQQTGISQTASISTSSIGLGAKDYGSSLVSEYLPAKSTKPGVITSTTSRYDVPATTVRPDLVGVTYKKPSSFANKDPSLIAPTTYRPSNLYYTGQKFWTASSAGATSNSGSPTNLGISREKIDKLITNYDRGSVRYMPSIYDTTASSGFGTTVRKFSSSGKSSFSAAGSTVAISAPSGPTSSSYEVTTKSPEAKGKVIIKWSDLHPLLLGKLGAECTCKADPFATLRGPVRKLIDSSKGKVDLANYDESEIYVDVGNENSSEEDSSEYGNYPEEPYKISAPKTTNNSPSSSYLPALPSTTVNTRDFAAAIGSRTESPADDAPFELHLGFRTGRKLKDAVPSPNSLAQDLEDDPDQIINGATDCARPGLFRHPSLCNKFYACHWDQWKKKFTLHIFNCPIHLTFDSKASACNWPSKGPACQADNLLV
ncbi:uncharacterized protein [Anoplolepis gracilipes]|uniref:uncharacterized protein n=1 Tax=Anoplolepis gracilipes TaxID=354296 RepID=UPI003BA153FF